MTTVYILSRSLLVQVYGDSPYAAVIAQFSKNMAPTHKQAAVAAATASSSSSSSTTAATDYYSVRIIAFNCLRRKELYRMAMDHRTMVSIMAAPTVTTTVRHSMARIRITPMIHRNIRPSTISHQIPPRYRCRQSRAPAHRCHRRTMRNRQQLRPEQTDYVCLSFFD